MLAAPGWRAWPWAGQLSSERLFQRQLRAALALRGLSAFSGPTGWKSPLTSPEGEFEQPIHVPCSGGSSNSSGHKWCKNPLGPSSPEEEAQWSPELTLGALCFQNLLMNIHNLYIPGKKKKLGTKIVDELVLRNNSSLTWAVLHLHGNQEPIDTTTLSLSLTRLLARIGLCGPSW